MHTASELVVPADAHPPGRPRRPVRGTLRLAPRSTSVISRRQLLDVGFSSSQLRQTAAGTSLERIAPGWYAHRDAEPRLVRALSAGYRLTCLDALEMHGVWTPRRTGGDARRLHVYRNRRCVSCPSWAIDHSAGLRAWPESDPVASLPLALQHAVRCLDGESAAIVLESAIARGLQTPSEVQELLDLLPTRARSRIGTISTASESGSETRVVRALRRRGFRVEQQVFVEGAGFVDAYAAGVFLEIDGRAHHSSPEAFEVDRQRDLAVRRHGLQLVRLSYNQTWSTWEDTLKALLTTIEQVGPLGRRKIAQLT